MEMISALLEGLAIGCGIVLGMIVMVLVFVFGLTVTR
jgi:threonine/homoserine/homoserine lactone efflux protein